MVDFPDNDQRARYLLSSNWLRDRGNDAAARLQALSVARSTSSQKRPRTVRHHRSRPWPNVHEEDEEP